MTQIRQQLFSRSCTEIQVPCIKRLSFISGPIKFLTSLLKKAMGTAYHRYLGFAARELAEGLTQIAVNDNNKKTVRTLFSTSLCY